MFAELGWQVALPHPHPGPLPGGEGAAGPPPTTGVAGEPRDAGLLGRETKGEVVLVPRLRAALEKLNPMLPRLLSGKAALPHTASPSGRGEELASTSDSRDRTL